MQNTSWESQICAIKHRVFWKYLVWEVAHLYMHKSHHTEWCTLHSSIKCFTIFFQQDGAPPYLSRYCHVFSDCRRGIWSPTGFIGSQSVTQLGYSVLHFTTPHKAGNGYSACVPLQPTLPTLTLLDSRLDWTTTTTTTTLTSRQASKQASKQ
jgi:hypothetical protein